jgi:hypothetical protein
MLRPRRQVNLVRLGSLSFRIVDGAMWCWERAYLLFIHTAWMSVSRRLIAPAQHAALGFRSVLTGPRFVAKLSPELYIGVFSADLTHLP